MPRFAVEVVVGAGADATSAAFSDYEAYPRAIPEYFEFVRTRSSRGDVSVAEERLRIGGKSMLVMARHETGPGRHDVFFIGGDAKGSSMRMRFAEEAGRTRVTMDVDLKALIMPGARRDCQGMLDGLAASV